MIHFRLVLIASLTAFAAGSSSHGKPVLYQLTFDVLPPPSGNGTELHGAHMELAIQFDAAQLSPTSDATVGSPAVRITEWPTTTTTAKLKVTDSAAADGVYENPAFLFGGWRFSGNFQGGRLKFPIIDFAKDDFSIRIMDVEAEFGLGYFPDPSITLYPTAFPANAVLWNAADLVTSSNRHTSTNFSGFAVGVPEPSVFAIAAPSLFAVSAIRRRR